MTRNNHRICASLLYKIKVIFKLKGLSADMTRSELIAILAERNMHLYQKDLEMVVDAVFDEITDALSRGDRVELRGFGSFSVKKREPRVGRNPRTGESVKVDTKYVPHFKIGKALHEALNPSLVK